MFKSLKIIAVFAITNILIAFSYTTHASQYDAELLALTNAERQNAGLPALTLSSQLGQAAQNHADDMAINNYFDHTGLNGSGPGDRAKAMGYNFSYVGENIYAGLSTPSDVINGWMNSQGHRENILNPNYTDIGFGYAYSPSSDYGHYWVQVFGRSSGTSTPTPQPTLNFTLSPMGDSITVGNDNSGETNPTSYRKALWEKLKNAGWNVDFVGHFTSQYQGNFDQDHDAKIGGFVSDLFSVVSSPWPTGSPPDVVLLYIGTNDLFQGIPVGAVIEDVRILIDMLRVSNPNVIIFLAQLFPIS